MKMLSTQLIYTRCWVSRYVYVMYLKLIVCLLYSKTSAIIPKYLLGDLSQQIITVEKKIKQYD